ncbi:hypothetical protein II654_02705, partial [bacterium]|nr:hypothetical protein [bacterium]
PFLLLLNSTHPDDDETRTMADMLSEQYHAPCLPVNCKTLDEETIRAILRTILMEFGVTEIGITVPEWMESLPQDHPVKAELYECNKNILLDFFATNEKYQFEN